MTVPKRVQMSRVHPWRADNPDAVIVDRRTKWGNIYVVVREGGYWGVKPPGYAAMKRSTRTVDLRTALSRAVSYYQIDATQNAARIRNELSGKDLACWCPLDRPCHADVLIELANPEAAL